MKTKIKVISYKKQPPDSPIEAEIGESGGTLGRAAANTCVLPDPDRFISGKHAAISYKSGKFYVTDTSTNGLFFEGDINPLGRDRSVELADGQRLVVGDYILQISIEDDPLEMGSSPFGSPAQQSQTNFFEKEPESRDDFFNQPVEQSIPPWQSDEPASNSGGSDFFTSPPTPDFGEPEPSGNDFFASDSDLLADASKEEFTGASEPDNVPAENQFFSAPNSIPEDWDILSDSEPEVATEPPPQPEPVFQPEPVAQTERQVAAPPEPVATPPPAQETAPQSFAIPNPGASKPRTQVHATNGGNGSASMQSLLRGARIEQLNIPETSSEQVLETSGELLRDSLDGLMQMLRARAEVKSEFRMEQTTIRAVENNPLKFSVTVDEALRQMLMPTSSAYLPPKEAMHEALNDIEAHQLAIMAGVQAALSAMLKRFEPEQLRNQFDKKSGRGLLETKKAWYWEQYEDKYKEILTEAEDSFQELFGEAFSKAYQEQVERLSRSRK
ncbi:type VI secretion system-associated FHA domain protein TagH [Vibrio sp. JC009]|uniref:type VI secretion system-associated FHA domain protein TagH n=1 Tax=Vibrio sp. JC009 TaxID=2912314 RepID=UPI0023B11683|nr:type VI secretion system-associated FHA domain protein TagH [Vibrio sp. JC009]WED22942.1 type VI secretion system-associated FHA domain protein TagH [Vibrio sp. JC009]